MTYEEIMAVLSQSTGHAVCGELQTSGRRHRGDRMTYGGSHGSGHHTPR